MSNKLRPALLNVLRFVESHPGGYRKPAMFSYRYVFDAPELKRAPFKLRTILEAEELGLIECTGPSQREEVKVSAAGRWWLAPPVACGSDSEARCAHGNKASSCRGNR